jgi:hypothetical protein
LASMVLLDMISDVLLLLWKNSDVLCVVWCCVQEQWCSWVCPVLVEWADSSSWCSSPGRLLGVAGSCGAASTTFACSDKAPWAACHQAWSDPCLAVLCISYVHSELVPSDFYEQMLHLVNYTQWFIKSDTTLDHSYSVMKWQLNCPSLRVKTSIT